MNPAQMALQIREELQTVAWPTGSAEVVFGTHKGVVEVFADAPTEDQFPPRFPACLVIMGDGTPDDDAPQLVEYTFRLVAAASVTGSPMGSHAIVGGPSRDLGKSPNRGVAEIITRVRAAVQDLTGADGAPLQVLGESLSAPFTVGNLRHVAFAELAVSALCTSDLFYSAPQELAHDGTDWTWNGTHCSNRFDFHPTAGFILRRKTGSAPTGPTDGTSVYSGQDSTITAAAVSGDTYGIFAQYDARGDGTADGNSDASLVGTTVAVA